MESSPYIEGSADESTRDSKNSKNSETKLYQILGEYKELLELQSNERQHLLQQVDTLSERTGEMSNLDNKLEHLVGLLSDIRQQISALSSGIPSKTVEKAETPETSKEDSNKVPSILPFINTPVVATDEQIEELTDEITNKADDLDAEIDTLADLLDSKGQELNQKDVYIDELNLKLESVSDEKERLAAQLESLNAVIGSWQGQLNLLQKLAASDPRYKVIGALKKHGNLSDIQLAFTMGTSIGQIRKYIDDLRELNLVKKDNTGRYIWIGKDIEEDTPL